MLWGSKGKDMTHCFVLCRSFVFIFLLLLIQQLCQSLTLFSVGNEGMNERMNNYGAWTEKSC
jgi:hypothetical protein